MYFLFPVIGFTAVLSSVNMKREKAGIFFTMAFLFFCIDQRP